MPRPPLLKQARSLLSKGAVRALAMLCPGGNTHLLQQLVSSPAVGFKGTYPDCAIRWWIALDSPSPVVRVCSHMQGGHAAMLGQILYSAGASSSISAVRWGSCSGSPAGIAPLPASSSCRTLFPAWTQRVSQAAAVAPAPGYGCSTCLIPGLLAWYDTCCRRCRPSWWQPSA